MTIELLRAPARQVGSLSETQHRPWPLPDGSWLVAQTWHDLLFAHWPVDAGAVQALLPSGLTVDQHDGSAWLTVTPFELSGFRFRGTLPLPVVSSFPAINVRTYVSAEGKPGTWLFSLDVPSLAAVEIARRVFRLPAYQARVSLDHSTARVECSAARRDGPRPFVFEAEYDAAGDPREARPGTLEHFLTERFCVYTADESRVFRTELHRLPWRLRRAEASIHLNTMPPDGIELGGEPLFHLADRQDVVVWPPEALPANSAT